MNDTMPKMESDLPCPFCGEPPEVSAWNSEQVFCTGLHEGKKHATINQWRPVWNTRRPSPASASLKEVIADCLSELLNKDDRTSPEEWPEMMMLTADELADYQTRAFHAAQPASERGDVIDECARVADNHANAAEDLAAQQNASADFNAAELEDASLSVAAQCRAVAAAIRALKTAQPSGRGDDGSLPSPAAQSPKA